MQTPQLITAWKAQKKQGAHVHLHAHNFHELVYYSYGKGISEINGEKISFSDSCFVIIPKNTQHNEIHHLDTEVICIGFSGASDLPIGVFNDASHTILKILNEIVLEVNTQPYDYKKMLEIKLCELMLNIDRLKNKVNSSKDFEYAINYIRENFYEHINLSDCAKQLNISYDYFQHKFKAITGYSPQQFLIEQRLSASKIMLKENHHNCTEIAFLLGFSTSAQFSAMFKKRFGLTPLQFKNSTPKPYPETLPRV